MTLHDEAMEVIHEVSSLTHRHEISLSACGIYINIAVQLIDGKSLKEAITEGIKSALKWYRTQDSFEGVSDIWKRLDDMDAFTLLPDGLISSGGYVVDTLEAALWCLLNTDNYEDCVLKAVNLGKDTDTTASVAGGLAGLVYGLDGIPGEWIKVLQGKDIIDSCCEKFLEAL